MRYTEQYETQEQRKVLVAVAEAKGHQMMQDNHYWNHLENESGEVIARSFDGKLIFEDTPDTSPASMPFGKAEYQAASSQADKLEVIAKFLGLES